MEKHEAWYLSGSMEWLFHSGTALIVMANIMGKFGLKYGTYFSKNKLKDNETEFRPRGIRTVRPRLTDNQIKNTLKKLEEHGFLKIIKYINKKYTLEIIINPFDFNISKKISDSDDYGTGFSWFGE